MGAVRTIRSIVDKNNLSDVIKLYGSFEDIPKSDLQNVSLYVRLSPPIVSHAVSKSACIPQ